MEQNKQGSIKDLAFVVPEDVKFNKDISDLSDKQLQRWHDLMHVFFEKLLLGLGEFTQFRWSFNKTIIKHQEIVNEMMKRQLPHHQPINNLDNIVPHVETPKSMAELSNRGVNISLNAPERIHKAKNIKV